MKKLMSLIFIGLAMFAVACSDDEGVKTEYTEISLDAKEAVLEIPNQKFAMNFLEKAVENSPEKNTLVSPLSLGMTCAMVANGLGGEGLDEMLSVMGVDDLDALNSLYGKLLKNLPKLDKATKISLANSYWLRPNKEGLSYSGAEAYARRLNQIFGAKYFETHYTAQDVNKWVSDATSKAIDNLVTDDELARTNMLWLNALHFESSWETAFPKENTKDKPFTLLDGSTVDGPMMWDKRVIPCGGTPHARYVELPYGNTNFSMFAVLPDEGVTIREALADFKNEETAFSGSRSTLVYLLFPKFELERTMDLAGTMQAMGFKKLFTSFFMPDLGASQMMQLAKQKVVLSVDEERTKVKVASILGIGDTCNVRPIEDEAIIAFNRPFLIFVRENSTHTFILSGAIMNPFES